MQTNRRNWLRQVGIVTAGLGMAPLKGLALPLTNTLQTGNGLNVPTRLSSNENPYGPSALAKKAMMEKVNISNRYNWELSSSLVAAIAKYNQVEPANILLGAGSTEILDLTARFAAKNSGNFILADPTYGYWADTAINLGLKKITVPLDQEKKHDLPAMLHAIDKDTRLMYLCNPNNPTGTICNPNDLPGFIKEATRSLVLLVDEAYIDFTDQQSIGKQVIENKNLVVAKTFSKIYGLAGARIGYAIAHPSMIEQLAQLQSWPNGSVSVVSAAGALASLQDVHFVGETAIWIEQAKKYTIEKLEQLNIPCIPSYSNFIYFSLANYKKDFFEQLKIHNINGTKIYEEKGKWSRITIGTMAEMKRFIVALG